MQLYQLLNKLDNKRHYMDAPLDKDIKKILQDKKKAKELMQKTIAGARNGYSGTINIDGKEYKITKTQNLPSKDSSNASE